MRMILASVALGFMTGCAVLQGIVPPSKATPSLVASVEMVPTVAPTQSILEATAEGESAPSVIEPGAASATPSPTPVDVPFWEPAGCQEPPSDYTILEVNGWEINGRTLAMLQRAEELYQGRIQITGSSLTQGSYTDQVSASFGTHSGGGAVDLSVRNPAGYAVLYDEIEPLIRALRVAGFAAWVRDYDELHPGSPIHIHAIAIGDLELSAAAGEQLTGEFGYFRGFSGVPTDDHIPVLDHHGGGPILCQWMWQLGYRDLRSDELKSWDHTGDWVTRLRSAAQAYVTSSEEETFERLYELNFLGKMYEHPSNMCGPLSAAMLRDALLLPKGVGPVTNLFDYWEAQGFRKGGLPWSLYPADEYDLFTFDDPVSTFDYSAWPLVAGDLVYTYAGPGEYEHIFVVTEVDEFGLAYTVTNQVQEDESWLIERLLLYDPSDPEVGVFKNDWVTDAWMAGRTGLGGFDVLRRKGISLQPGSTYYYRVKPGDTLPGLAARFNSQVESILRLNAIANPGKLAVGQVLILLVNSSNDVALGSELSSWPRAREIP